MLATVTTRWPALVLDAATPLSWRQRGTFRGLDALFVRER